MRFRFPGSTFRSDVRAGLAALAVNQATALGALRSLQQQVATMSQALDNLKAAVAAQTTVDQSAVTLIQGLAKEIGDAASNSGDADLQALADELTTATAPLAAAVTANTPAQAAPGPAPAPAPQS